MWLMELFFFVAGFATLYALRKRSARQYLVERVKRLLIPLYTVGLFIINVPQAYFEQFSHNQTTATFWQWLPGYFAGLPGALVRHYNYLDPIQILPYGFAGHLWFIMMLFLICLVTLPALLYLRSTRGQGLMARLAGWAIEPGGILMFAIPLALVRIALNWLPISTDRTWSDFLWYAFYFVFGFIFAADARFTESIKKHSWLCLGLWLGLFFVVGGVLQMALGFNLSDGNGFSLVFVIWQIAYALASWSSVVFVLSLGAKYLNFNNKYLTYSNEAVLPFYIFHQTVILVVGWFVLPWQIGALMKFLIIAIISFPVILFLYEVFVRHINFMRFLFGMLPLKKQVAIPEKVVPAS